MDDYYKFILATFIPPEKKSEWDECEWQNIHTGAGCGILRPKLTVSFYPSFSEFPLRKRGATNSQSFEDFINEWKEKYPNAFTVIKIQKTDGYLWFIITNKGNDRFFWVKREAGIIELAIPPEVSDNIANQMLSTFRFLE